MELVLALAADDVRERTDGNFDVQGVRFEFYAPGFPAVQERMVVVLVVEWAADEVGLQPLRADLVDEAGTRILTIEGHTEVEPRSEDRAPPRTRLVLPLQRVVFPHPGRYYFDVLAGDQVRRAIPLFVGKHP